MALPLVYLLEYKITEGKTLKVMISVLLDTSDSVQDLPWEHVTMFPGMQSQGCLVHE